MPYSDVDDYQTYMCFFGYCKISDFLPPIPAMIPPTKHKAQRFPNFFLTHSDEMEVLKERKAKKETRDKKRGRGRGQGSKKNSDFDCEEDQYGDRYVPQENNIWKRNSERQVLALRLGLRPLTLTTLITELTLVVCDMSLRELGRKRAREGNKRGNETWGRPLPVRFNLTFWRVLDVHVTTVAAGLRLCRRRQQELR